MLESFSINMTLGALTLSFTEVILETSFDPTNIALLNAPNGGVSLTLSSQSMYTRSSTGTKVEVDLIPTDLNWLKARSLYTSRANSYLSLVTNLVDIAGNVFQDIQVSNAIQAEAFAPDTAPPTAASFDLFNIDNGSFIITFNEPVDTNTVNFHMITLLNTPSGSRRYGVVTNQSSRKKGQLCPSQPYQFSIPMLKMLPVYSTTASLSIVTKVWY